MEITNFIACNDGKYPGVILLNDTDEDLITYIGRYVNGWWFWMFYIDKEDNNLAFLSHLMENSQKYTDQGYSEGMFDTFEQCIYAAMKGFIYEEELK